MGESQLSTVSSEKKFHLLESPPQPSLDGLSFSFCFASCSIFNDLFVRPENEKVLQMECIAEKSTYLKLPYTINSIGMRKVETREESIKEYILRECKGYIHCCSDGNQQQQNGHIPLTGVDIRLCGHSGHVAIWDACCRVDLDSRAVSGGKWSASVFGQSVRFRMS